MKQYSKRFLSEGIYIEMRGQPIAVMTATSHTDGVDHMLGAATMCECMLVDNG